FFSTKNVYKFAKVYFAYDTQLENRKEKEITQETKKEIKEDKELYPIRPKIGEEIGELYIPKLEATLPIYHGTDEDELEKGVGHFAESVLPGEKDNSVLSGHRDTVFRKLGEVGEGDSLIVRTSAGEFQYKVNKVRIVDEDDRTVIVPKPRATLTVSTCYPFNYIGSAPERYILVAYLASKTLN
ncbi:class D sortase, partial [Metabacillus fastidiosus]|uniref:class D sortase n=1 Tax=Metabacillus fastidiosus TaxID=1458 RepID=UPI002DBCDF62